MEKITHKTIAAYVLTKTGIPLTDKGITAVRDIILDPNQKAGPSDYGTGGATGVMVHTGPDLLDAAALSSILGADPMARVVVSEPDKLVICAFGPDPDGLPAVISVLDAAAENGTDSWTALERALGRG